jgi:hypothetical protein
MTDISAKLDETNPRTVTMTFVVKHDAGTLEEKVFLTSFSSTKVEGEPEIAEPIKTAGPITTITHDEGGARVGELVDEKIKASIKALNPFDGVAGGGRRTKHRKLRGGKKSMRRHKKHRKC